MISWLGRALLLALWLVGMVRGNPLGPWLHVLLVAALLSIGGALVPEGEPGISDRDGGGGPTARRRAASG